MTPKEKAEELIKRFSFNCRECDNSKLCALVAVDEIINTVECVSYNEIELDVKYWQEVKQEIEKL